MVKLMMKFRCTMIADTSHHVTTQFSLGNYSREHRIVTIVIIVQQLNKSNLFRILCRIPDIVITIYNTNTEI